MLLAAILRRAVASIWGTTQREKCRVLEAEYVCAHCGKMTGKAVLTTAHESIPVPENVEGVPPGIDTLASRLGWASITLQDFGSFALIGADDMERKYEDAIRSGSAQELYELNPDACPYWCQTCGVTYCRTCWRTDSRTTSDNLYANCPAGHLRKIWGD